MREIGRAGLLLICLATSQLRAADSQFTPINLSLQPEPESVYAPIAAPREDDGINQGAVHLELSLGYATDYVFRGVEILEPPGPEDRPNLQIAAKLSFDLGKLPHPFVGVFVNVADSDPVSRFQTVQPFFGADWFVKPFVLTAGHTTYLFPDRDFMQTSEVFGQVKLDDSFFLHTEKPIFSPYVYGAYDYDRYNGWYLEAGVSHEFAFEGTGLTITANANIAYVIGYDLFETQVHQRIVDGLQHYQAGLIGDYSLNQLLNFSPRFGNWSIEGFVYYTDGIKNDLRVNTQIWSGAAIVLKY